MDEKENIVFYLREGGYNLILLLAPNYIFLTFMEEQLLIEHRSFNNHVT